MKRVFLDTVGLIAIWDSTDQWNAVAVMAMLELMKTSVATITTEQILMECGNASSRRPYRCEVNALRKKLKEGGKLFQPTEAEMEQAWEAYDRQDAAGAGIVDQVSFIMMRRLGITEAFTNDEHFRAAGFVTLF